MHASAPLGLANRRRVVLALVTVVVAAAGVGIWSDLSAAVTSTGPDVTVFNLGDTHNYGALGGFRGYSVGTTSCNVGDAPVQWCENQGSFPCTPGANTTMHPVISENLYRLAPIPPATNPTVAGRFEQIGMSWLKHGFESLNTPAATCLPSHPCGSHPPGSVLEIGCTDTYQASLNGNTPLGRRSEVNPSTGIFPYPYTSVPTGGDPTRERIQVLESEVNPALNAGARYWAEGQYVTADDAAAGNGLNNASYREVTFGASPFNMSFSGSTVREKSAVEAWLVVDPTVELFDADVAGPPIERFQIARKVTEPTPGTWHYEYVVHNMNSQRAARAFSVYFPTATAITNVGFHDIDNQTGEITTSIVDWTSSVDANGFVSWFTEKFADNPNANSLRWGMTYTFWFDADQGPTGIEHAIELFTPGSPATIGNTNILLRDGLEAGSAARWQ